MLFSISIKDPDQAGEKKQLMLRTKLLVNPENTTGIYETSEDILNQDVNFRTTKIC